MRDLLEEENLRAGPEAMGKLTVALTDPPDAFLEVAREALRLDIGTVQLRAGDSSGDAMSNGKSLKQLSTSTF